VLCERARALPVGRRYFSDENDGRQPSIGCGKRGFSNGCFFRVPPSLTGKSNENPPAVSDKNKIKKKTNQSYSNFGDYRRAFIAIETSSTGKTLLMVVFERRDIFIYYTYRKRLFKNVAGHDGITGVAAGRPTASE